MKKHFYLGVLILLLASLGLAACGGTPQSTSGPQKVTINFWSIATGDPQKTDWQNVANAYMKAHPNVTIKITLIENDAFKQKLTTVMQSGNPPDLFQTWGGGVLFQYAQAGLVQDLTSALQSSWGNSFSKSALGTYGTNGKYYGVPYDAGAIGFWYNKALFAKAGIAQPPATWNDLLQDVTKLKSAGITPIALGEKDKWPGHYYWAYLAERLGGQDAFNKAATQKGGSFTDPPFIQAGQYLQQLVAMNPFQAGYLGASYTDQTTIMGNGKAAMELMGQWAENNDKGAATDKKGPELGFFPFPAVPGGAGNPSDVFGGGGGLAVGKNAPPETIDFLKSLISTPVEETLAKQAIVIPPMPSAASSVTDPLQRQVQQMVSQATYFQLYYDQYFPTSVANAVLDGTQAIFAKTGTPQACAQGVQSAVAALPPVQ